jgi:hypothetical protein
MKGILQREHLGVSGLNPKYIIMDPVGARAENQAGTGAIADTGKQA